MKNRLALVIVVAIALGPLSNTSVQAMGCGVDVSLVRFEVLAETEINLPGDDDDWRIRFDIRNGGLVLRQDMPIPFNNVGADQARDLDRLMYTTVLSATPPGETETITITWEVRELDREGFVDDTGSEEHKITLRCEPTRDEGIYIPIRATGPDRNGLVRLVVRIRTF
jgi:hypothetical protein